MEIIIISQNSNIEIEFESKINQIKTYNISLLLKKYDKVFYQLYGSRYFEECYD